MWWVIRKHVAPTPSRPLKLWPSHLRAAFPGHVFRRKHLSPGMLICRPRGLKQASQRCGCRGLEDHAPG